MAVAPTLGCVGGHILCGESTTLFTGGMWWRVLSCTKLELGGSQLSPLSIWDIRQVAKIQRTSGALCFSCGLREHYSIYGAMMKEEKCI